MDPSQFRNELNKAIDYHQVLLKVSRFASFSASKQHIEQALPYSELAKAKEDLAYIQEGIEFIRKGKDCSLGGISDIQPLIESAKKGIILLAGELMQVSMFLSGVYNAINSFHEEEPLFFDLCDTMDPCIALRKEIDAKIDLSGDVKENATLALERLIQQQRNTRAEATRSTKEFARKHANQLMDTTITTIQGRFCVLAKASEKNTFGGLIHSASQSGLAYYVEPSSFVKINNTLQSLELQIEEEKKAIRKALSRQVKAKAIALESDLETITKIDSLLARSKWAYRYDGCVPVFQQRDSRLQINNARHPLIDEKKVVANDYALKPEQYCLMVSGPNMGGKTVTLKTIGLFVALSHAGFPVLAHEALFPWFESMWFDIGDHQSIEQNLSTFSSHMSKIATICEHAKEKTFLLLDEIGNGTDPNEGASLASAILEYLIAKKATIITSTHYEQVKAFGTSNPHTLVSSVEFDLETLKPTYRYLPGISGGSFAFSIAKDLSLDEKIIDRAIEFKESQMKESDKALERLEIEQKKVMQEKERFDQLIKDAHDLQKKAEAERQKWERKYEQLQADYDQRLEEMLEEKREEARSIIKSMQSNAKVHEQIDSLHQINQLAPAQKEEKQAKESFKVGDYVHISSLNSHGEIIEIRKKQATVLSNGMKMNVKLNTLSKIERPRPKPVPTKARVDKVSTRFPLELNLIGMRVEEGLQALDHYLDQAIVHKAISVRIIHGMGTGKLRAAIWNDLKKRSTIKSFQAGGPQEGGLGATIVNFK